MLEKPDIHDERVIACLQDDYGLNQAHVTFLPLGADVNAAVYRVATPGEQLCFLKLRRGDFDETSVALPRFLSDQGIAQIIPPLKTMTGQLWTNLDAFTVILYPYVEGQNGYQVRMSDAHWASFGTALRRVHAAKVPPALRRKIREETYSPRWRTAVIEFMKRVEGEVFADPVAQRAALFLNANRDRILDLVRRADRLAQTLRSRSPELIVCHSDIHAGNILLSTQGDLYIVDWDEPILAPRERDLMYVGGGLLASGRTPQEEEALFYRAYGPTETDPVATAYYRYERIVMDVAAYCEQLLLTDEGGQDREQSLRHLQSCFWPNGVLDIARQTDRTRDPPR